MNKEYMVLLDDKIGVFDENGKLDVREINDTAFASELLMRENEYLDEKIMDYNKDINKYKTKKEISLKTLKSLKYTGLVAILLLLIIFGKENLLSVIIGSLVGISVNILKEKHNIRVSNKKITGFKASLEVAKQKQEENDKKIKKIKNSMLESTQKPRLYNPVSLEFQTNYSIEQIDKYLNRTYESAVKDKPKTLVMKPRKK